MRISNYLPQIPSLFCCTIRFIRRWADTFITQIHSFSWYLIAVAVSCRWKLATSAQFSFIGCIVSVNSLLSCCLQICLFVWFGF